MRVAAIRGGSHIPLSTGMIWTPKVIALFCVGVVIMCLYFGSVHSFLKNDTRHAIGLLVVCAGLAIIFFRRRKIALAVIVLSVLCGWSYPISLVRPTVLGWTVTLSSGALYLALIIWLTKKYPDMKQRDFKKLFDRDPE
jgi:K+ transporter